MRKIVFIYPANRSRLENEVKNNKSPDNALYGLNHLREFGNNVYFKDVSPRLERLLDLFFLPLIKLFLSQIDIDFKLSRALLAFSSLNKADLIVVNTDGIGLAVCFLKRIGFIKKPIIYAVGLFYIKGRLEKTIQKNKKTFFFHLFKWILSAADQILYHAPIEKEKLLKLGIFDPAKCVFVPIGSDAKFFKLKKFSQIKPQANTVVSVGKDRSRDYKTLLTAARLLPKVSFIVVCRKSNIAGLEIPPNLKVYFDLPYHQVAKLYHQAQVIVIPNREMKRSSGQMTLTDCLQCAKPIIVSDISGLASYHLKEGFNVLKVRPNDSRELKEAIARLLRDKKLRDRLIKNSKELAENYTTLSYARKLNEVVKFLCAEISISALGKNDLEYVRRLRNQNSNFFFNPKFIRKTDQKKWYKSYLDSNTDYIFVLKKGNSRLGIGAIYDLDKSKKIAQVGRFIIDQKYRNKGYGKLLLENLEYLARERLDLKSLYLEVFEDNRNAKKLYEKSGFKEEKSFVVNGRRAIHMIKNLN